MRKELKNIVGKRMKFVGTFKKKGYRGFGFYLHETILLIDIKDSQGNQIIDHLWFNSNNFQKIELKGGDRISFEAKIGQYVKGYEGSKINISKPLKIDYNLVFLSEIKKIKKIKNSIHKPNQFMGIKNKKSEVL